MRKNLLLLVVLLFSANIVYAGPKFSTKGKSAKRAAASAKGGKRAAITHRGGAKRALTPVSSSKSKAEDIPTVEENTNPEGLSDFALCMDKLCKSTSADDEKGRCRCSSQLGRIEKILRDIEKIRDEADAKNKNLEVRFKFESHLCYLPTVWDVRICFNLS